MTRHHKTIVPVIKVSDLCPRVSASKDGEKVYEGKRRYCPECYECMRCANPFGVGTIRGVVA